MKKSLSEKEMNCIHRAMDGCEESFSELMERHQKLLLSLVTQRVRDFDHSEDIMQEILLKAWRNIGSLREPERLVPWLMQIARNACHDFYRSSHRREIPLEDEQLWIWVNQKVPTAVVVPGPLMLEVEDALRTVSSAARETAQSYYLEGLSIPEIARRSGCPQGTIKRRLYDVRNQLRVVFETTGEVRERTLEEEQMTIDDRKEKWIGDKVTFRTWEKAPAQFDAWTFFWRAPRLEHFETEMCYVVILPNGEEHFVYEDLVVSAGGHVRSDFGEDIPGGDVRPFQGEYITVQFRSENGRMRFTRRPDEYSFGFYQKQEDGNIDWRHPTGMIPAQIQ